MIKYKVKAYKQELDRGFRHEGVNYIETFGARVYASGPDCKPFLVVSTPASRLTKKDALDDGKKILKSFKLQNEIK